MRCDIVVNFSNGMSGRTRINVKPENVVTTMQLTNEDIMLYGRSYGKITQSGMCSWIGFSSL